MPESLCLTAAWLLAYSAVSLASRTCTPSMVDSEQTTRLFTYLNMCLWTKTFLWSQLLVSFHYCLRKEEYATDFVRLERSLSTTVCKVHHELELKYTQKNKIVINHVPLRARILENGRHTICCIYCSSRLQFHKILEPIVLFKISKPSFKESTVLVPSFCILTDRFCEEYYRPKNVYIIRVDYMSHFLHLTLV